MHSLLIRLSMFGIPTRYVFLPISRGGYFSNSARICGHLTTSGTWTIHSFSKVSPCCSEYFTTANICQTFLGRSRVKVLSGHSFKASLVCGVTWSLCRLNPRLDRPWVRRTSAAHQLRQRPQQIRQLGYQYMTGKRQFATHYFHQISRYALPHAQTRPRSPTFWRLGGNRRPVKDFSFLAGEAWTGMNGIYYAIMDRHRLLTVQGGNFRHLNLPEIRLTTTPSKHNKSIWNLVHFNHVVN